VTVIDNTLEHRFEETVEGGLAYLAYELDGERLVLSHTVVPEVSRDRGIGGHLVEAAVEAARSRDLSVVPQCSFARSWLHGHPEIAGRVKIDPPATI
jgi:predicted GNAT family acetyltransferase